MSIVVNKTRLPVTQWQTESGSVVSVSDARKRYAKSLSVALEPIQDLHGYSNPWVGGAGKNLAPFEDVLPDGYTKTERGITVTVHNGVVHLEGVSESQTTWNILDFQSVWNISGISNYPISAGTYSIANGLTCRISPTNKGGTFSITETAYIRGFYIFVSGNKYQQQVNQDIVLAITAGSTIPTAWTPYENLCPISGTSSVTAYRAGVDQFDNPQSVTLSLGQTVYGGTVDLVSGVMAATHIEYTYNGSESWYLPDSTPYIVLWGQSPSVSNNDLTQKANWLIGAGYGYLDFGNFRAQTNGAVVVGNRVSQSPLVLHWQTAQDFKDFLADNPLQVCYELATPQTIQLSPNQIEMLMRNNTVWSDAGVVTLEYARIRQ